MTGKRILIVDDQNEFVEQLARRCENVGLTVDTAQDATTALAEIHLNPPDLVWIDLDVSHGSGLAMCELLTRDDRFRWTPIVVAAESASKESIARAGELGVRFVAKTPALWPEVESLLGELLGSLAETPAMESPSTPTDTQTPIKIERPIVLCIDDDPDISRAIKLRLEPYGVDVLRAFSGMQGYWTALDSKPDVIVTDMVMPDGEGNYILGRLQQNPVTENIPVIVVSGQSNQGLKRQMLGAGAVAFLDKPVAFDELLFELKRYIAMPDNPRVAQGAGHEEAGGL